MANPAAQRSSHATDTEYHLPNDAPEHTRPEAQVAVLSALMHNKPIHAPLHSPDRLLDIGCGTGAITHLLGTTYPTASNIYGIDLSPVPHIQRPEPQPPNIDFIQGDVRALAKTDERLARGSFDYVFSRLLICGMTDWKGFICDIVVPLLKPGGWVEVQDLDYVWYKHGHVCSDNWDWVRAMKAGANQKGLDLHCGRNAARYMREAGLVDVSVTQYWQPFGTWAAKERPESKGIGEVQAKWMAELYEFILPRMVEGLGLSEAEVKRLVEASQGCLRAEDGKEWPIYVTIGRRP